MCNEVEQILFTIISLRKKAVFVTEWQEGFRERKEVACLTEEGEELCFSDPPKRGERRNMRESNGKESKQP